MSRDKEGHCKLIQGSSHQGYTKILTLCAPDARASKYVTQKTHRTKWRIKGGMTYFGSWYSQLH
jgi:hypothetical protein